MSFLQNTNKRAVKEPACILAQPKVTPYEQPLTADELGKAKADLVNKSFLNYSKAYPQKRLKRKDPPLNQQNIATHSFVPAHGAQPDSDGCFGVLTIHGTFSNEQDADEWSEKHIREVNSYAEILFSRVGEDFPLTNQDRFCADTKNIDLRESMNAIAKDHLKEQRQKENQEMSEVAKRAEMLREDVKAKPEDRDDLEFYTERQVKRASHLARVDDAKKAMQQSQEIADKVTEEIERLNKKHPEYLSEFKKIYAETLAESGHQVQDNPIWKYLD